MLSAKHKDKSKNSEPDWGTYAQPGPRTPVNPSTFDIPWENTPASITQEPLKKTTPRLSSIARNITLGNWFRRFSLYLLLNCALLIAFFVGFAIQCNISVSTQATVVTQRYEGDVWATVNEFINGWQMYENTQVIPGSAEKNVDTFEDYHSQLRYSLVLQDGSTVSYYVRDTFALLRVLVVTLLIFEIITLISALFETRTIRRKLKPLNDLALTAEALSSAAASTATYAPHDNNNMIEHLERAIATATVDSPQINTGDKDLKSIEVALNGLLRQMQEAKLQQMHFVDDASHELRTPIAVIEGYVNMLDRWGKDDPEVLAESIEALKHESSHMRHLVEQLLFLARGDSGRNTLKRETYNMRDVLREVCEESAMIDADHTYVLGKRASQSNIDTSLVTSGDIAMVKQSMRIMVQNAAKYSPKASTITFDVLSSPGKVGYYVQDEGSGMSQAEASHVFERFWRADAARSSSEGGSGLGLSIAKWIVDAHEGTIQVLSLPNVGTRFTVWFPVV